VSPEEVVARERRFARPVAIAAFAAIVAFIAAIAVNQGGTLADADTDAQFLAEFSDNSGNQFLGAVLQAAGFLFAIAPISYLFQAAAARSDSVRSALVGITVAGPLFLAIGAVLQWFAFDQAASEFSSTGGGLGVPVGEYAEELIQDQAAFDAAQGFTFAGTLGLIVAIVYTSLHAMRTGLLTRFWGSLGMALGVSVLFLGFVGILVYVLAIGMLIGGLWIGDRPAAWEAGRAIPWPSAGGQPPDEPAEEETTAAEPANPGEPATGSEDGGEGPARPPPRKRKRRR
jgi:uncharacterized membrane protein (DUF485 family)